MKRIIFILAAAAAVLLISGCNMMAGSGVLAVTEYDAVGFKAVEAGNTCDLTVTEGDQFSVTVTCDDNLVDYLDVQQVGDFLVISLMPYSAYHNITFKASVVMPEINALEASGASKATVTGFDLTGDFSAVISGASTAGIRLNSADSITAVVSGASILNLDAASIAGNLDINCSGASKADFMDCAAGSAAADVSGASSAWINLNGILSGTVSGASTLYYAGNPDAGGVYVETASGMVRL